MAKKTKKPELKVGDVIRLKKGLRSPDLDSCGDYDNACFPVPAESEGEVTSVADNGTAFVTFYKIPEFEKKQVFKGRPRYQEDVLPTRPIKKDAEYELIKKPEQFIFLYHDRNKDISKETEEIADVLRKNKITDFKICDMPCLKDKPKSDASGGYFHPGIHIRIGSVFNKEEDYVIRFPIQMRETVNQRGFSGPCIDGSDLSALKEKLNDIFSEPDFDNKIGSFLDTYAKMISSDVYIDISDFIYNSKKPSAALEELMSIFNKGIHPGFLFSSEPTDPSPNVGEYIPFADELAKKLDKKDILRYTGWLSVRNIRLPTINEVGNDSLYEVYKDVGDVIDNDDILSATALFKEINSNEGLTEQEKEKSKSEVIGYYKAYDKERWKSK